VNARGRYLLAALLTALSAPRKGDTSAPPKQTFTAKRKAEEAKRRNRKKGY